MKKLLLVLLFSIASFANSLNIGDTLPSITLQDQFEKSHTVSMETKTILVAFDRDASDVLKDYLLKKDGKFLHKNKAVYIGDISEMPYLVTKFFAMPKMKKYNFSILFLDDKNRPYFSKKEDQISVYRLENGKIKNLSYISKKEELEALFN